MAADARGPGGDGASDDEQDDAPDRTPRDDPPPPGFLDLGGGQLYGGGTQAEMLAAAAWLDRSYPEHSQDPPAGHHGPILNMGYELTREARAGMPRGWSMGQRAVVLILADICNDRTRRQPPHMDVSERLLEELDITPGALGNILSALAAAGFEFRVAVGKDRRGRLMFARRGHAVDYQFPAMPPRKGPSVDGPKAVDNSQKGPSTDGPRAPEGPLTDGALAGKGPSVDGEWSIDGWTPDHKDTNRSKEDAPAAAAQLAQDQDQDQIRRVDGEAGDWGVRGNHPREQPKDDGQDQRPAALRLPQVANSQKTASSRLNEPPVADDAQRSPLNDAESTAAGSCARASEAFDPSEPAWKQVQCPVCKAAPRQFCRNPAGGGVTATHKERYRLGSERQAEALS